MNAMTGRSNFDISESMLRQYLTWLGNRDGTIAVLCKSVVARKVLRYAWTTSLPIHDAKIYMIDTKRQFNVSVDAVLLILQIVKSSHTSQCVIYPRMGTKIPSHRFGFEDDELVANSELYLKHKSLKGPSPITWRSGVKHDCASIFQFSKEGSRFRNRRCDLVELDEEYLFPLARGSDVANNRTRNLSRWVLITQSRIGEDTLHLKTAAPRTWAYLTSHAETIAQRKSSIYRGQPRFSIFGVGPYTFAPWKVAIAALYKRFHFAIVGPQHGKPVVFDDTTYFVPCQTEAFATELAEMLNSPLAREFFEAFVFWDAKRPVTVQLLNRLDLVELARKLGKQNWKPTSFFEEAGKRLSSRQKSLF